MIGAGDVSISTGDYNLFITDSDELKATKAFPGPSFHFRGLRNRFVTHGEEVEIRSGPWTENPQQVICEYVAPVANGSGEAFGRSTVHFPLFMLYYNALACIFCRCTMYVVSLHRGKEFVGFCLTVTVPTSDPIDLSCNSHSTRRTTSNGSIFK